MGSTFPATICSGNISIAVFKSTSRPTLITVCLVMGTCCQNLRFLFCSPQMWKKYAPIPMSMQAWLIRCK